MFCVENFSDYKIPQNNKKNNSNFFLFIYIILVIVSAFVFFTANPSRSFSLKEYKDLSFYQYDNEFLRADINENLFRIVPTKEKKTLLNTNNVNITLNYVDVSEQQYTVAFLAHMNIYTSEGFAVKLDSAYINGVKNDKNSNFIHTTDTIVPFFYTLDVKSFETVDTIDLVFSVYNQGADTPIMTKLIRIYQSENYKK